MKNPIIHLLTVFCVPMALVVCLCVPTYGAEPKKKFNKDIIFGVNGGYTIIEGYYKSTFKGYYCLGATFSYSNPLNVKFIMGELGFIYARYPMTESKKSSLTSYAVNLGPLFYYPIIAQFQIFAGVAVQGSYLKMHADRTRKNTASFKPGLLVKAGIFTPIRLGIRIRAGIEYSLDYLSSKPMHRFNFTASLSYNFNPDERLSEIGPIEDPTLRADWYLTLAEKALRDNKVNEAKSNYTRVLMLDRNNREAREKLEGINAAEDNYNKALKFVQQKRYYEALPLLEKASKYLTSALDEQKNIRRDLAGEIAALEKKGIELYEKGDYKGCIGVMNQILLIDPKNRVGMIYLPRAVKRQEALERLR